MEKMNDGRPSEWAYSILRKDRDDLKTRLDILRRYHGGDGSITKDQVFDALSKEHND